MKTLKLLLTFVLMVMVLSTYSTGKDWRTASREPAGIAPDPSITNEAVLHVYGAGTGAGPSYFCHRQWLRGLGGAIRGKGRPRN